jgi:murein DD-endopeptidase MepM/ murein hydrolase activator NlpD
VFAVEDGQVEHASAAWAPGFSGYGGHVVIRHAGGERTLYAHLSAVSVQAGDHVPAGARIGAVGRTAFTREDHSALLQSGPHLHFEVSATPYPQPSEAPRLDPVAWLEQRGDPPPLVQRRARDGARS